MKTNFLLKIFYIFFILLGMQSAYSDSLSFDFLYTAGIGSVYLDTSQLEYEDYATDVDKTANFKVSTSDLGSAYRVTINADITHTGSTDIAKVFNEISGYLPAGDDSREMELNGPESYAVALDFWAMAPFYIDGHFVGYVTLAHNNHSNNIGANDWWITVDSGKRYELDNTIALTVNDNAGNYYCLSQNGTNYQVTVAKGNCPYQPTQFIFKYGDGVESVDILSPGAAIIESQESGQIFNVEKSFSTGETILTVNAVPLNSADIANNFNSLIPANGDSCGAIGGSDIYKFEVRVQGYVCGPSPQYLDFYIPIYLMINDNREVVAGRTTTPLVLVLAHGGGRWWLGTTNAPFYSYTGAGAAYNNQAVVYAYIPDTERSQWARYKVDSIADNEFNVHIAHN